MKALICYTAVVLVATGCGADGSDGASGAAGSPTHRPAAQRVSAGALKRTAEALVLRDLRLRNDARARNATFVIAQMRQYADARHLTRRAEALSAAVRKAMSDGWPPASDLAIHILQSRVRAITTRSASIQLVGYESFRKPSLGRVSTPLRSYDVRLSVSATPTAAPIVRLVSHHETWLSTQGPLGTPGNEIVATLRRNHKHIPWEAVRG
jgi:hypothetical protein